MMGTGNRINGAAMPLMGLPYRRYSVPETVMRKYSLSRAQTSESSESGVATVPTPSVPSASFKNTSEGHWSPDVRYLQNKRMLHKACQTSPRASVEKEIVKSDSVNNEKQCDIDKTIPILQVTSDSCNDLVSKVSDNESSPKSGEHSQLYCDETEYYQTYDAKKVNCDLTIPGAISEPSSVFLIVESNNLHEHSLEQGLIDEKKRKETQAQRDFSVDVNSENKKIFDDLTQWISSEHIQYLLSNTTNRTLKNMLQEKSKSFPETKKTFNNINQRSRSAQGNLTGEENFVDIISDSDGVELKTDSNCIDDTPTPFPPSTGQTESHSSEGDCYMTDCEICAAEGRKCCSLDESCSQTFSFTSPEMISTNGLKTSSDFTSSSGTLDQTVSDRSTSTQDSTLSITSLTPESFNSKSTGINISPLLIINTETFLIQPVESGSRSRDFTFHPSDSTPRTTPSPSKVEYNEEVKEETCQVLNVEGGSSIIPLVISSESALINPIKENDLNVSYSLGLSSGHINSSDTCKSHNLNLKEELQSHDNEHLNNNDFESNEIRQIDYNHINTNEGIDNDPSKHVTSSTEVKHYSDINLSLEEQVVTSGGVNFQFNQRREMPSQINLMVNSDDQNESFKNQPGDDFEMDSLAIEDSGSSEDITVGENTDRTLCGSENLTNKEHTSINNSKKVNYFKASNTEDDMSSEDTDLLEKLGFCENNNKNKSRGRSSETIDSNNEISYNEKCREQVRDMFYGNKKYEVIVKENKQNNPQFKGNVMTTRDDKSSSLATSNSEKTNNNGIPLLSDDDSKECVTEFSLIGGKEDLHDNDIIVLKSDGKSIGTVTSGTYWETPGMELIIPRYSAMPRTLSMLVNTSSMDYSSDSDLSLADSLEDATVTGRVNTFNKHDNRLVRGGVMALLPETGNIIKKQNKESRAYFLSLTGEEGEIKTEPIPDELKKKLQKRDNEIKRHSGHTSRHTTKKPEHKRSKKHRHHSPVKHSTSSRKDRFESLSSFDGIDKSCKSTQWEDIPSSRAESSDTLLPSDTSEKDVGKPQSYVSYNRITITQFKLQDTLNNEGLQDNYNLNQVNETKTVHMSTNTDLEEVLQLSSEGYSSILEKNLDETGLVTTLSNDKSTTTDSKIVEEEYTNYDANKEMETPAENGDGNKPKKVNKWVQSIDSTFSDTETDKEISKILLEAYRTEEVDNEESKNDVDKHTKDAVTSTDLEANLNEEITLVESDSSRELEEGNIIKNQTLSCSKSVQTDSTTKYNTPEECGSPVDGNVKKTTFSEMFQQTSESEDYLHEMIPPTETILLNSISNEKLSTEDGTEENRCKTPVFGEKPTDKTVSPKQVRNVNKTFPNNKQGPRFNIRTAPNRRIGHLSTRFRQRFEVIPEEKNGSMDSSAEEKGTSPPPLFSSRRASIPTDMLLTGSNTEKTNSENSISSDRLGDLGGRISQFESCTEARRHTIHGNLESRRNKTVSKSFEKNEQNRRHTIHGNLALTPRNTALIKKLDLMGGTVLKGRVFSKRSGVMIGQFRPMNEETQVEKDEKSAVGEQLERLRRGGCKGRQALAVTQNQEHEELLTLSKGWINFYLLKDSQDLGSDGSNGEEGSQNSSSVEEKLGRNAPAVKPETVVNKPEEKVRQYSVQIHAVPEQHVSDTKLPDVKKRSTRSSKTPPQSPDCILPDITSTSSPNTPSPTLPELSKTELPQLQSDTQTSKTDKGKVCTRRHGHKKELKERLCPSPVDSEKSVEYLKLLSPKQESEKTFLTCSGDLACSEQSPSSITSSTCDSATESPALPSIKWPARHLHRRTHPRYQRTESTKHPPQASNGTAGQACWTVTLAGSSGYPTAPPPDVEMRLSFPNNSRGAPTSQSDSGLGEENFRSHSEKKSKRQQQQALPPSSGKRWSLSIKNPQVEEKEEGVKLEKRQFQSLPDVSYQPTTARSKKSAKVVACVCQRGSADQESAPQLTIVWPKVQGILEQNLQRSLSVEWNEGLTVTGLAITPEQKPRVPTMSERDLTRNLYLSTRSKFSH